MGIIHGEHQNPKPQVMGFLHQFRGDARAVHVYGQITGLSVSSQIFGGYAIIYAGYRYMGQRSSESIYLF